MTRRLATFFRNQSGATAIEYGLIAAMIAVAVIGGLGNLGSKTGEAFTGANSKIQQAQGL